MRNSSEAGERTFVFKGNIFTKWGGRGDEEKKDITLLNITSSQMLQIWGGEKLREKEKTKEIKGEKIF